MKYCPNCGTEIPSEQDQFCINCGYQIPRAQGAPKGDAPMKPGDPGRPAFAGHPVSQGTAGGHAHKPLRAVRPGGAGAAAGELPVDWEMPYADAELPGEQEAAGPVPANLFEEEAVPPEAPAQQPAVSGLPVQDVPVQSAQRQGVPAQSGLQKSAAQRPKPAPAPPPKPARAPSAAREGAPAGEGALEAKSGLNGGPAAAPSVKTAAKDAPNGAGEEKPPRGELLKGKPAAPPPAPEPENKPTEFQFTFAAEKEQPARPEKVPDAPRRPAPPRPQADRPFAPPPPNGPLEGGMFGQEPPAQAPTQQKRPAPPSRQPQARPRQNAGPADVGPGLFEQPGGYAPEKGQTIPPSAGPSLFDGGAKVDKSAMAAVIAQAAMQPTGPVPPTTQELPPVRQPRQGGRPAQNGRRPQGQPAPRPEPAQRPARAPEGFSGGPALLEEQQPVSFEQRPPRPDKGRKQPKPEPPALRSYDQEREKPKRSAGRTLLTILLAVVIFAVATAGVTTGLLYFLNRPAKVISDFTLNIQNRDYEAIDKMVVGLQASGDGWAPLCDAFAEPEQLDSLRSELEAQAEGGPGQGLYPAIVLEKSELFWFINRYTVRISPVDLLVPAATQGTILRLDGVEYTGSNTAEGLLVQGVVPGQYTAQVVAPSGEVGEQFTFTAFNVGTPNPVAPPVSSYAVTVANCLADDATLYVNGVEMAEKPQGGVVSLPSVALGSEIRILVIQDGQGQESVVTFTDPAQTALSFGEYLPSGTPTVPVPPSSTPGAVDAAAMTATQIDPIISAFYKSYLDCVNAQNISGLQLSTQANTDNLSGALGAAGNVANSFAFVSAACDPATIVVGEENGVPTITFDATFTYKHWPRGGAEAEAQQASNVRSVQLVYQNGQWLVNRFDFKQ